MARLSRNRLKTPINIIRSAPPTRSKTGAVLAGKEATMQVFCELLPIGSREFVQAQAQGMSMDAKLHVDYETDIMPSDKIQVLDDSNMLYEVVGLMPVPQDNKKIIIAKAIYGVSHANHRT